MAPGPSKQFDADRALVAARDLFWRRGYDGTGIAALEATLGVGRKSLYDTFGSKRALYLRALTHYADSVIQRICDGLERPDGRPLANLERVLRKLQEHHGSGESVGCMLGVALAQADRDDEELTALLEGALGRLERAFERTVRRAQAEGAVRADLRPKDVARHLVALTQGLALLGRAVGRPARARSTIRAALQALRP